MTWKDFEVVLAVRGDAAGVRMYYLEGQIELMSPSRGHETNKKSLARLLELWALETDTPVEGYGSWTLKDSAKEAGAEPDECYVLGDPDAKYKPDLAIEVAWSRGGLSKLEIYQRLGVGELWLLNRDTSIEIWVLDGDHYTRAKKSRLFPKLDVGWLVGFLNRPTQTAAVRALRDELAKKPRRPRR
jgi:Uma2 family endonuclease